MFDFKVSGIDELMAKLTEMSNPEFANQAMVEGIIEGAGPIRDTAKMLCPVGDPKVDPNSGQLRNSIEVTPLPNGASIGSPVEYAPYVELGTGNRGNDASIDAKAEINPSYTLSKTRKDGTTYDYSGMAPQPYLYPALKAHEQDIPVIIKNKLNAKIKGRT